MFKNKREFSWHSKWIGLAIIVILFPIATFGQKVRQVTPNERNPELRSAIVISRVPALICTYSANDPVIVSACLDAAPIIPGFDCAFDGASLKDFSDIGCELQCHFTCYP